MVSPLPGEYLRLFEFCCLRQFAWALFPLRSEPAAAVPASSRASADPHERNRRHAFSHLSNSQKLNTLSLELEHELHTHAKVADVWAMCPSIPTRICLEKSTLFIFQTF